MYGNIRSVYRWTMNKPINRSPNGVCVSAVTKYLDGVKFWSCLWLINLTQKHCRHIN